jgi:hypothetical protein
MGVADNIDSPLILYRVKDLLVVVLVLSVVFVRSDADPQGLKFFRLIFNAAEYYHAAQALYRGNIGEDHVIGDGKKIIIHDPVRIRTGYFFQGIVAAGAVRGMGVQVSFEPEAVFPAG